MNHALICHPDTPARAIPSVEARIRRKGDFWMAGFFVANADALKLPSPRSPERSDGLWKQLCFELFVRAEGKDGYIEFNFSPSRQWAAYRFDAYRAGMRDLAMPTLPEIRGVLDARVSASALPPGPVRVGLSAVIEEADGTRSYWALAHPPGKPDFHHPDCFALQLPAAG